MARVREVDEEVESFADDLAPVSIDGPAHIPAVDRGSIVSSVDNEPDPADGVAAIAPARSPRSNNRWLVIASVVAALPASTTYLWLRHSREARALGTKDSILLTDFENQTGEPVFDGALREGLAVELGQSPFLDLVAQECPGDAQVYGTFA